MLNQKVVDFYSAEVYLKKNIPFKIYKIDRERSGIRNHTHDYIQIWYICKGKVKHCINNKVEYEMLRGNLYVMPPFAIHSVRIEEEAEIIGCEFLPNFINDQFKELNLNKDFFDFTYLEPFLVSEDMVRPKISFVGEVQEKVQSILEEMLKEYEAENKYYEIFLKGNLLRLLAIIVREYEKGYQSKENKEVFEKYRQAIVNSIEYLRENYNTEIHLEDICKYSMMSRTYFCYVFKGLTGKTFNGYLTDLRIQKSIELLSNTDMSVRDICFKVGFNDMTHFCVTFRKHVGVSPKNYRKTLNQI